MFGLGHLRIQHIAPAAPHLLQQAGVGAHVAQLIGPGLEDVYSGHQHPAHRLGHLQQPQPITGRYWKTPSVIRNKL